MRKLIFALSGVVLSAALCSAPALADTFTFAFSGSSDSGSGMLTASATGMAGQYLVTGISGTTDGATISALLAPGTYPVMSPPNDNDITPAGAQVVDVNGVSYVAGGVNYNLFYDVAYGIEFGPNEYIDGLDTVTITPAMTPVAATPEPESLVLVGTGVLGLAGALRRRLQR